MASSVPLLYCRSKLELTTSRLASLLTEATPTGKTSLSTGGEIPEESARHPERNRPVANNRSDSLYKAFITGRDTRTKVCG
jgi:hypothetical protein